MTDLFSLIQASQEPEIAKLAIAFRTLADLDPAFGIALDRAEDLETAYQAADLHLKLGVDGLLWQLFAGLYIDQKPVYAALERVMLERGVKS
jgi:hypothetical protein